MKSLDEIRRIKRAVEKELMKLPGVTGVDVGPKIVKGKKTDIMAIRVYVEEKKDVSKEISVPKEIQGVPTDVIQRRFVLHSDQKGVCDENSPRSLDRQSHRPCKQKAWR